MRPAAATAPACWISKLLKNPFRREGSFLLRKMRIKLTTSENETEQIKQLCIPQAPSVSFADSSRPEGASSYMFLQKTAMLMRKRSLASEPPSGREVARRSRDGRSHRAQMRLCFIKLCSFSGASRLGTLGISSPNPRQGTSPLDPMFASRLSKKLSQLNIPKEYISASAHTAIPLGTPKAYAWPARRTCPRA